MRDAEYHRHPALSQTKLSVFDRSPRDFQALFIEDDADERGVEDDKAGFRIAQDKIGGKSHVRAGSAVHALLFMQEDELQETIRIIPESVLASNGARSGNAWKDYRDEHEEQNPEVLLLRDGELKGIKRAAANLRDLIGRFIDRGDAMREHVVFWEQPVISGTETVSLEMRLKADLLIVGGNEAWCFDAKSTHQLGESTFRRNVLDKRYWLQQSHYQIGIRTHFEVDVVHFFFPSVQMSGRYPCGLYYLDDESSEKAERRYANVLQRFADRVVSDNWADEHEGKMVPVSINL